VFAERPKKRANSGAVNVVERTGEDKKFKVEIVQKYTRPKARRDGTQGGIRRRADPRRAVLSKLLIVSRLGLPSGFVRSDLVGMSRFARGLRA
jgi:hypothetical protein